MALPQWPAFLPAWQLNNLVVDSALSTNRSSLPGYIEQSSLSDRHFEVISATLSLEGIQVPIAEYFLRDLCNEGCAWFVGPFVTSTGLETIRMRLVEGKYSLSFRGYGATLSATIERYA